MATQRDKIRRRQREVRQLAGEGLSQRQIAKRLKVSKGTIVSDLRVPKPNPGVPNAAGRGNTRGLSHGVRSERTLSPVRKGHVEALKRDFPALDDRRLVLLADRLARIELASRWLDDQGGVMRDNDGEVFSVARELERWTSRAEQVLREIQEEHRAGQKSPLTDYLVEPNGDA